MIDKLIEPATHIIGKFVKDKDLQAKLDHELQTLFHQANLAQIEILKEDAKSKNWFQNSWRPFVGWTCGVALCYHFVLQPFLLFLLHSFGYQVDLPVFDMTTLTTILLGMLGLGGMRSFEKVKRSA